jgi:hypothetical protein
MRRLAFHSSRSENRLATRREIVKSGLLRSSWSFAAAARRYAAFSATSTSSSIFFASPNSMRLLSL